MANDPVSDEPPMELPDPVSTWLKQVADEEGISEEELLGRLVDGARPAIDEGTLNQQLTDLESSLQSRIDEVDAEFQTKLEDVRNRVIQVKRETDSKAPGDHRHESLQQRVETLGSKLETLEATLDETSDRFDQGFENYEDILEYLTETADEFDRKLDALANAVVDLRDQFESFNRYHARQQILDQLTATANRLGIQQAACDSCDNSVDIGLLVEPRCPYCEEPFADVERGRRFIGTNNLITGTQRALEGEVMEEQVDLEARFEGINEEREPPGQGHRRSGEEAPHLESIDGIGPEYARRLGEAGVETTGDLAAADPTDLAATTGISKSRLERWIEAAAQ